MSAETFDSWEQISIPKLPICHMLLSLLLIKLAGLGNEFAEFIERFRHMAARVTASSAIP